MGADLLFLGAVFFVVALSLDVVYALTGSMISNRLRPDRRRPSRARFVVAAIYLALASYTIVTT